MARIRTYANDETLTGGDKLLGTDVNGNPTRNFTLDDLKEYIESGVNVLVPVPAGFIGATDNNTEDFTVTPIRQTFMSGKATVNFYPASTPEANVVNSDTIESVIIDDSIGFRVVSDTNSYFEIIGLTSKFDVYSFANKKINYSYTYNGATTTVVLTLGDLVKQGFDRDSDGNDDIDLNYAYLEGNIQRPIFRFEYTAEEVTAGLIPSTFSQVQVVSSENDNTQLQEIQINMYAPLHATDIVAETLDIGLITFDETGEGIEFGQDPNPASIKVGPSNDNIDFTGAVNATDGDWSISDDLTVGTNLLVHGTSQFNGSISVADSQLATFRGGINVWGPDNHDLIRVGLIENAAPDSDHSEIIIRSGTEGEAAITRQFYNSGDTVEITYVVANDQISRSTSGGVVNPTNQGALTSIQVGDDFYTVPTAISRRAAILPGVSEDLAPLNETNTSYTIPGNGWWIGTDEGSYATTVSNVFTADGPGDITVSAGSDITVTVPSGDPANAILELFSGLTTDRRLFFVTNTAHAAIKNGKTFTQTPNDEDTANTVGLTDGAIVMEVVNYNHETRELTFHNMQGGHLVISTPIVEFQNVQDGSGNSRYLTLDDNGELGEINLDAGSEVQAAIIGDSSDDASGPKLRNLTFNGGGDSDYGITHTGSSENVTIDITGRLNIGKVSSATDNVYEGEISSFEADVWHQYVLAPIPGGMSATNQIITLPTSPDAGDVITIHNLSDIDTSGSNTDVDAIWEVNPGTNAKIMKGVTGENLELNEATTFDLIWSGYDEIGWLIK